MMNIPVSTLGRIVGGPDAGVYVRILDDSADTGGFLIVTSDDKDFSRGFDNWVEDRAALLRFLQESEWVIQWEGVEKPTQYLKGV
jgi:hypothetical protein